MKNSPKVYLVGNAHLDPVWLWRFPDGLSEIKATFRSALDRIAEFQDLSSHPQLYPTTAGLRKTALICSAKFKKQ